MFTLKPWFVYIVNFFLILFFSSCRRDKPINPHFNTENVVILIMDGPRYSETGGDPTHQYIPHLHQDLSPLGTVCQSFRNNGPTYTTAGHTAITTGFYQEINNGGAELPQNPSLFQYYLQQTGKDSNAAWIIASKDKLAVLGDCVDEDWKGKFRPSTDCGINGGGVGSGYRHDTATFTRAIDILSEYHPNLTLINFREPDWSGHQGIWANYLQGIRQSDSLAWGLWQFIQSDPVYQGKTTFIITNDHGRHLDGISSGFSGHGDDCEGCRRINFFACGPDFKANYIAVGSYDLVDIPVTVAYLLQVHMTATEGEIMYDLIK